MTPAEKAIESRGLQQSSLPGMEPPTITYCLNCFATRGKVEAALQGVRQRWPKLREILKHLPERMDDCPELSERICCDPGHEHRCPTCRTDQLDWRRFLPTAGNPQHDCLDHLEEHYSDHSQSHGPDPGMTESWHERYWQCFICSDKFDSDEIEQLQRDNERFAICTQCGWQGTAKGTEC